MNEKTKQKKMIFLFSSLILLMLCYIAWVFYISEPKWISNPNKSTKDVETYDIVSIRSSYGLDNELLVGIVIQVDTTTFKNTNYAVVKIIGGYHDEYRNIVTNTITPNYSIVGAGTIYHKINQFVGFNLMRITTIFIIIISSIIFITLLRILYLFFDCDFFD